MFRRRLLGIATVVLAVAGLLLLPGTSDAQRGRGAFRGGGYRGGSVYHGGYPGGYYGGGLYHGGYYGGYNRGYYGGLGLLGFGSSYPYGGWGGLYSAYSYPSYRYAYSSPSTYSSYSYPSYSYYTPSYSYAAQPSTYAYQGTPASYQSFYPPESAAQDNDVHVRVAVPSPDAEVWFEGVPTQQKGTMREFESPPLTPGQNYTYHVRARWMENGQPRDQTRSIVVQAGQHVNVDFNVPDNSATTANDRGDRQAQPIRPALNTGRPAVPPAANQPLDQQPIPSPRTTNPAPDSGPTVGPTGRIVNPPPSNPKP